MDINILGEENMGLLEKLGIFKEDKVEDMVMLNGTKITRDQLQEKKKEASQQKGVRIVESAPNIFRTKIEG